MKKLFKITGLTVFLILFGSTIALAAADVGVNASNWLSRNVTGLFPPVLAVISIFFLAKREFTRFLGFAVFALIVSVFVYSGDSTVKTFAQQLANELLK